MTATHILAGDVGGTKTILAVFSSERGAHEPIAEATFTSADYANLESIVQSFLSGLDVRVSRAVFGVAGPVLNGSAQITNLPWVLSEQHLRAALGLSHVHLINDLAAIANAVPVLNDEDTIALNDVSPTPRGAIGVIAPGTGLGEAFLLWVNGRYHAFPSEGGHNDFAPSNELEGDLLRYLQRKFGRASYERVCSGIGIPNVYYFLRDCAYMPESPAVAAQLASAKDPTPVIVANALVNPPDPLCAQVMDIFTSVLAARGRQPGADGDRHRWHLPGRGHPAAHPAPTATRILHEYLSLQRAAFRLDGAHPGAGDHERQGRLVGRCTGSAGDGSGLS